MSRWQHRWQRTKRKCQRWMRAVQRWMRAVQRWVADQVFKDAIAFSLIVLAVSVLVVGLMYRSYALWTDEFWKGVFIEFTGMIFDIAVFGVVIALYLRFRDRHQEVRRQQEIIDDFKKWGSDEARYRIAGAIRVSMSSRRGRHFPLSRTPGAATSSSSAAA